MSSFAGMDLSDITQVQALLQQLLADPSVYPEEFKAWLPNYLATNPPDLNIDQINGFQQFTVNQALNPNSGSIGGTAYNDLNSTDVGPTISKLSDGLYLFGYGAGARTSNTGVRAKMNLSINGVVSDTATPQAYTLSPNDVSIGSQAQVRLSGGVSGNTVTCKYCVGGSNAVGYFSQRYMNCFRVSS